MRRPALLLPVAFGLAGCAPDTNFPSLKPRPIEAAPAAVAAPPAKPPAADPARDAEVADLARTAESAAATFETEAKMAEPVVARAAGAATGSEQWVLAQQALARLEAAREPLTRALAGLDALRIEAEAAGGAGDATALDAAWTRAQTLQQQQIERYEALSVRVPPAN